MNVVIFSGTTEGREISRRLAELGLEVTVSVATPLGQEEQGSAPGVTVRCGRLLPDEMAALLKGAALCIDATHPYAVEATKNIRAAAARAGVEYHRLLRAPSPLPEGALVFAGAAEAAQELARTVTPGALPCSSAPRSVATLTRTSAPRAPSCLENARPSVVPLNTTALIACTPGA